MQGDMGLVRESREMCAGCSWGKLKERGNLKDLTLMEK